MKTKKPTAKLPKGRATWAHPDMMNAWGPSPSTLPVAVIPCHTAAQARQICKAAPFLQMTEEGQQKAISVAIFYELGGSWDQARAVLRAMGLGGGK